MIATFVTLYGGYFFLSEEISSIDDEFDMPGWYKFVFFLVICVLHGLFLIQLLYQFHLEVKLYIKTKSEKWYYKIYLCNNKEKIQQAQDAIEDEVK